MKYAVFNEKGLPIAFYDPNIHKDRIPSNAIQITDEVWKELLTGNYAYINGILISIVGKIWDEQNKKWINKPEDLILKERKEDAISYLNIKAKQFITDILKELNWGDTYEEALTELQNTAISIETKILYFLKPKIPTVTLTEIREKLALYIAGQYSVDDLKTELSNNNFSDEEIEQFLPLFTEAARVASLIYWIESVWEEEEKLEEQINNAQSVDEINNILSSVQFPTPN